MAVTYGGNGIRDVEDFSSSSTVSSYDVDLNTSSDISCIYTEQGYTSEGGAARILFLNGTTTLNCNWRLMINSTTGTYTSLNATNMALTYYTPGALSASSYAGEHTRTMLWVYNRRVTSEPYAHPCVYGTTSYESTNGQTYIAHYTGRIKSTSQITSIRFYNTSGPVISWYRGRSWTLLSD